MTNQTCRLQRNLINHFHLLNDAFSDMLFTLLQSARLVSGVIENNYQRLGESLRDSEFESRTQTSNSEALDSKRRCPSLGG